MGDKYTGTTLIQNASPEDVNKAVLDLLKKTNEVSFIASDEIAQTNANLIGFQKSIKNYIIDFGNTATGTYQKYFDGTLVCYYSKLIALTTSTSNYFGSSSGTTYYGDYTWVYPAPFNTLTNILVTGSDIASSTYVSTSLTQTVIRGIDRSSGSKTLNFMAIGTY